ncbi:helix-turn-helix domain-containing protein [Sodalis sp. RH22]
MTIHKVIQEERLRKAKELLTTTAIPISEICKLCSYNTIQYFYFIFNQQTGMTPSKYRNSRSYQNQGKDADLIY